MGMSSGSSERSTWTEGDSRAPTLHIPDAFDEVVVPRYPRV